MNWAACITTLNEAESVGPLVSGLRDIGIERVIVVDGGSSDATVNEAKRVGARSVIGMKVRTPIRACLMAAWVIALEEGAERIVQLDAGFSHYPGDARKVLQGLEHADMAIGSRFAPGANFYGPRSRARRSRLITWAANRITGARFTDWTSGMRAFRPALLRELLRKRYRTAMHTWQIEVLDAVRREPEARIVEVPIDYFAGRSSGLRAAVDVPGCLWRLRRC